MKEKTYTPVDVVATIRIYGQIIGPMNNPEAYTTIILKAISTSWEIIQDTTATTQTDQNGNYDFSVYPGKYAVFFERRGLKNRVNDIQVYSDSQPGPLQNFMLTPVASDLTPLIVRQTIAAAELVNGKAVVAVEAAKSAKSSADSASTDAELAGESADSASSSANSASQSASSADSSASSAASDEVLAHQWADNPEDEIVKDGEYSAFHWAQKAKAAASDGAVISITSGESVLTPDEQGNVTLGTAATLDATTSTTDNTVGHVLKVGDRGLAKTLINASSIDFDAYLFAAGETLFLKMPDCTNIPDGIATSFVYAYVDVIGVRDTKNDVGILIGDSAGTKYYWALRYTDSSGETSWIVRVLPQSAADISAVPQYSDPLAVDLNTLDGTKPGRYQQPKSNAATTANHYPVTATGSLDVIPTGVSVDGSSLPLGCVQEYRRYDIQSLFRRTYSVRAGVWSWSEWAEEYSTANPPPATDLSAYMKTEDANAKFVQGFQFGAVTQVSVSGNQYKASPACVLQAIQDNDTGNYPSLDSVDDVYQKPAQININDDWFTVAG
ncbi:TPA: prophage tail fiber N-terminal domain-containing protein [Citrobacter werkmanii]